MTADATVWPGMNEPRVQKPMVTLKCPHCKEALYMEKKALEMTTWTCPSCHKTTRT